MMTAQNVITNKVADRNGDQTLKAQILKMIEERPGCSFAELSRIEGFRGDFRMLSDGEETSNVVLWDGISLEATDAIRELMREGLIQMETAHFLVYLIDGCTLSLPLAKWGRHYKQRRWLPVVFRKVRP